MTATTPRVIPLTPDQEATLREAMRIEKQDCASCQRYGKSFAPQHFSCFIDTDRGVVRNGSCESFGRKVQPDLTFTGTSHCTCDFCF